MKIRVSSNNIAGSLAGAAVSRSESLPPEIVNDKHSQLNATVISEKVVPANVADLIDVIRMTRINQGRIAIAGGRHAMGGQQFLSNQKLVDMTGMKKVLRFDRVHGLIEVESGIFWSELIGYLSSNQQDDQYPWSIAQKQTGCDELSIGGSASANIHGRGLKKAPFIEDIEDFVIVMSDGVAKRCNRQENVDLFRLAIGGYGLFGIISSVTVRLVRRALLQRHVELVASSEAIQRLENHIIAGATYGDFQFSIDDAEDQFLKIGILSTYYPVDIAEIKARASEQRVLSLTQWRELLHLAHVDKGTAFSKYVNHYLSTNSQIYSSDSMQQSTYLANYHSALNDAYCAEGSEMITELYVPRASLYAFLSKAAELLKSQGANVIYGTVRLIERDCESYLAWARQSFACIIFNLHVEHTEEDIAKNKQIFRDLIQTAFDLDGSFYLTYHRYATKQQLQQCYPKLCQFIEQKKIYDANDLFGSDWYDHLLKLATSG